jgi:hypothetical protein
MVAIDALLLGVCGTRETLIYLGNWFEDLRKSD